MPDLASGMDFVAFTVIKQASLSYDHSSHQSMLIESSFKKRYGSLDLL
jgi:hypothetical protein